MSSLRNKRKKLVIITSRFPYPLEKGDKLRAYHQLKELSLHFDIVLISTSDIKVHKKDIDEEYGLISVDFEATFEDGELVMTSKKNLYRIKKEPPSNR